MLSGSRNTTVANSNGTWPSLTPECSIPSSSSQAVQAARSSGPHVQGDVVEAGAGFVEGLPVVAAVGVQTDDDTGSLIDQQLTVAGVLTSVVRELHRYPVGAEQPLIPVQAGLDIGDGDGEVVDSRDRRNLRVAHLVSPITTPSRRGSAPPTQPGSARTIADSPLDWSARSTWWPSLRRPVTS